MTHRNPSHVRTVVASDEAIDLPNRESIGSPHLREAVPGGQTPVFDRTRSPDEYNDELESMHWRR